MAKKLLFAASEMYPFAKTGGLADVAYALPMALKNDYDITVVIPLYRSIEIDQHGIKTCNERFDIEMGGEIYPIELHRTEIKELPVFFVSSPILSETEFLYGTPEAGYENNGERFALFSYVITEIARREGVDILHLNDWQTALSALLIHQDPHFSPKVVYTIHNLAYQGIFEAALLESIGIDRRYFSMQALEFYGKVNFMKGGIAFADEVSTVSPTYAKEIMTPEFGCGLEGFLKYHQNKLKGIVNGIDVDHFSPKSDPYLVAPYEDSKGKKENKTPLLKEMGLKGVNKPLFVFIGRFTYQKGVDILIEALGKIATLECNVIVLGDGEKRYQEPLQRISSLNKNVSLSFGYDESLSHRVYAAADFLIMPSLFEPCGLNQLIAFAYGAVPIVHRVGGLADTVKRIETYQEDSCSGYGLVFNTPTSRALFNAVQKGYELYGDKKHFDRIVRHNMRCDYSWKESALAYRALYEQERIHHV